MAGLETSEHELELAAPWLTEDVVADAFGDDEPPEKLAKRYKLSTGDRPFARSVRVLFEASGRALPPEVAALRGETYLVTHAIGLIAEKGAGKIGTVGYEATFEGDGATVDLLPNTRFREWFSADLQFKAGIGASGYAELPDVVGQLAGGVIPLGAGANLDLAASAKSLGQLRLSIKSPKIQAVGHASSRARWHLDKDQTPLVGDQVLVQTVVVPKDQKVLRYQIEGFAVIDPGVFARPVRFTMQPITAEVTLDG